MIYFIEQLQNSDDSSSTKQGVTESINNNQVINSSNDPMSLQTNVTADLDKHINTTQETDGTTERMFFSTLKDFAYNESEAVLLDKVSINETEENGIFLVTFGDNVETTPSTNLISTSHVFEESSSLEDTVSVTSEYLNITTIFPVIENMEGFSETSQPLNTEEMTPPYEGTSTVSLESSTNFSEEARITTIPIHTTSHLSGSMDSDEEIRDANLLLGSQNAIHSGLSFGHKHYKNYTPSNVLEETETGRNEIGPVSLPVDEWDDEFSTQISFSTQLRPTCSPTCFHARGQWPRASSSGTSKYG